jgi:hypothetical protein
VSLKERIKVFVDKGWVMEIADTYVRWVHPSNCNLFIKVPTDKVPLTFIL